MTRYRSIILGALVVLVIAAVGYAYWRYSNEDRTVAYVTETIDRGAVTSTVTATGIVNPVTSVQVGTYVSGAISNIDVDFNSPVKKGQRVAKIDPAPFQVKVLNADASLANARARVDKDRADLAFKKLTLDRNRELSAKNLIPLSDVDTAKSDHDQAVAQVALDAASAKQAEAALQEAQINLNYTDITSPVDGVVVSRNVDVGQTVAASFQTPTLFLIARDLTKMQVDANVSESDIGSVRNEQPASFLVDAYPGKQFHGVVKQVRNAPTTVQNVVTYDVVIGVDNIDLELKPGMTANVTITSSQRDDVIRVPLRALRFNPERRTPVPNETPRPHRDNATSVWVLQADRTLRRVKLDLGTRNDQFAEVVSGALQPGDAVATAFAHGAPRPTQAPSIPGLGGGGGGMRRMH